MREEYVEMTFYAKTQETKDRLRVLAGEAGMSMSEWLRTKIDVEYSKRGK